MPAQFAAVRLQQAGDQLQQRGLAGAVRAQHRKAVSAPQGQIEILKQRSASAVSITNAAHLKQSIPPENFTFQFHA
ncbi:hypothetical protein D3C81_2097240 [compost metagenome]